MRLKRPVLQQLQISGVNFLLGAPIFYIKFLNEN